MATAMINSCAYHYEDAGTGMDTVAFVPGLMLSGRMYHNQVRKLRDRYRCLTYDLRGHARSGSPDGGYSMAKQAADLAQLIQTWHQEPVHLVGSAMGGIIGLHLALRRPDLLRSLTIIGASGAAELQKSRLQMLATGIRVLGPRPFVKPIIRNLFAERFLQNPDFRLDVEHWRKQIAEHNRSGLAQSVRAFAMRPDLLGLVKAIKLPVLLISGEKDAVFGPQHGKELHTRINNARLSLLPQAGHCPALEAPDAVNDQLQAFLGDLRRPIQSA